MRGQVSLTKSQESDITVQSDIVEERKNGGQIRKNLRSRLRQ